MYLITENVSTVCLVPSNINIPVGTTMNTTGWGKISDASTNSSPALRTVSVPTITNQQCANFYSNSTITDGVICTNTTGGKGTCRVKFGSIYFLRLLPTIIILNFKFKRVILVDH